MTLFVRNLALSVTAQDLEKVFSDVAPVKNAFVVVDQEKKVSKGYGFVSFVLESDAQEAMKKMQGFEFVDKRKMFLDFAEKKGYKVDDEDKKASAVSKQAKQKEKVDIVAKKDKEDRKEKPKKKEQEEDDENNEDNEDIEETEEDEDDADNDNIGKSPQSNDEMKMKCSLILFNIPLDFDEKDVRKRVRKIGKVVELKMPVPGLFYPESNGRACLVTYDDVKTANKAMNKLKSRSWGESTVVARRMKHVALKAVTQSNCRLIIRNLDFNADEAALKKVFEEFGPLVKIHIPRKAATESSEGDESKAKSQPVHRGFGFVQFACRHDAALAIEKVNGTKLGSRAIAVDWALSKSEYEKALQSEKGNKDEAEDEGESKEEEQADKSDDDDENSDSESAKSGNNNEDEDKEENEEPKQEYSLFIRNLLFETTDYELYERFKLYGAVKYAKIVRDPNGRSKGIGFVGYYKPEGMDAALKESIEENGGIILSGRLLSVSKAVSHDEALDLKANGESKKRAIDKRHLYLAKEGRIRADSEAGKEMPSSDLKKREFGEREKNTKLKSPLFFISPVRLSVRNLDRTDLSDIDDRKLEKIFKQAAIKGIKEGFVKDREGGDPSLYPSGWPQNKGFPVKVLKAKVMREPVQAIKGEFDAKSRSDLAKTDLKAKVKYAGRPTGAGFVEFSQHVHALAALRVLNNNPDYSFIAAGGAKSMKVKPSDRPRLIVEFTLENASKVRIQKMKQEKSRTVNPKRDHNENHEEHEEEQSSFNKKRGRDDDIKKQKKPERRDKDSSHDQDKKEKKRKRQHEETEEFENNHGENDRGDDGNDIDFSIDHESQKKKRKRKRPAVTRKTKRENEIDNLDKIIKKRQKSESTGMIAPSRVAPKFPVMDATQVQNILLKNKAEAKTRWFD